MGGSLRTEIGKKTKTKKSPPDTMYYTFFIHTKFHSAFLVLTSYPILMRRDISNAELQKTACT